MNANNCQMNANKKINKARKLATFRYTILANHYLSCFLGIGASS